MSESGWRRQGAAWDLFEMLCGLSADAWFTAARRVRSTAACSAARRELRALVRQGGLSLPVWDLTDGLETVAWYMSRRLESGGWQNRQSLSRDTLEAAHTAALALLLRSQLGERRFWLLYEPFQAVFPQRRSRPQRTSRVFTESLCGEARGGANVQEPPSTRQT